MRLKLKIDKQPPEILAVLINAVVFLFDMLLVEKLQYPLFQLSGAFSRDDLHGFDFLLNRLVDDILKLPVDLVAFVVDVVKVEFQFGHACFGFELIDSLPTC